MEVGIMLVDINHLSLGYEKQTVINDITFSVDDNDFIIVLGSNGVGKSTLIKGMLGLIKPISGDIKYYIDNVGYMPQETRVDPNFPASVMEVILSGFVHKMKLRPFHNKQDKAKALEIMEILKISDLKKKNFCELSGGQRQKPHRDYRHGWNERKRKHLYQHRQCCDPLIKPVLPGGLWTLNDGDVHSRHPLQKKTEIPRNLEDSVGFRA